MAVHTDSNTDDSTSRSEVEANPAAKKSSSRRWLVLMSGFSIMFLCTGFPFSMSVLMPELLRTFERSRTETALVQSFVNGMFYVAGLPCERFVDRYGARMTGIAGGLLVTLGLFFSFFAQNIPYLIVTVGLVSGLGFSATFISALTSIGEYFDGKSKLVSLAFLTFGAGCGGIAIPFLLHVLIEEFGLRGCLLITGGLEANMLCFFAICKPVSVGLPQTTVNNSKELAAATKPKYNGFTKSLRSLVGNKLYLIHVVALCIVISLLSVSYIFMIDFLTYEGIDTETAVALFLYSQIGITLCGVVPGLCKKYIPHISVFFINALFTMIGSVATALLPNAETYAQFLVLLVCVGMTIGVSLTAISMTTVKIVDLVDYTAGLGILMTLLGISNGIAGPIAGLIADITGSYTTLLHGISIGLGFSSCMYLLAAVLRQTSNKKDVENKTNTNTDMTADGPAQPHRSTVYI